MAAYFIVDTDIEDMDRIQEYRKAVPRTIQKYEGRYLVRAGRWEVMEGKWTAKKSGCSRISKPRAGEAVV